MVVMKFGIIITYYGYDEYYFGKDNVSKFLRQVLEDLNLKL